MTLVEDDGVLRWVPASGASPPARYRRGRRRADTPRGTVVETLRFERLKNSQIGSFLKCLDEKLNPQLKKQPPLHLRALTRDLHLAPKAATPIAKGRILLMIHGTFSHSQNTLDAFSATPPGKKFLKLTLKNYDQVLFFDHPTLQVSPVMNAVDLEVLMRSSAASVDTVCHSRGGLVARWWAEAVTHNPARVNRVMFVGSPLAGTSLAAPPKLRRALNLLTNVFNVFQSTSALAQQVAPFMVVATGLMRVLGSASKVVAKTPLIDAAVAAVPGLAGMSRVGDNPEIVRLRRDATHPGQYFAIASDFEPTAVGWRFWRFFTQDPKQRIADVGADLLFDGPNDLVVDTPSMADLHGALDRPNIPDARTKNFPTNGDVHHLNYFLQTDTLDFLQDKLKLRP